MNYDPSTILEIISFILLPSALVLLFRFLLEKTKFGQIKAIFSQLIIGLFFGCYSIFAIQFGISFENGTLIIGTCLPLVISLCFDGFGGIFAGVIACIYRIVAGEFLFADYWNRYANGFAFLIAGILGYLIRKFVLKNKTPSWFFGFIFGGAMEGVSILFSMLLSFTNIYSAFEMVCSTLFVTIFCNAFLTMLPLLLLNIAEKKKTLLFRKQRTLSEIFQLVLLSGFIVAYIVTVSFTYAIQTAEAETSANALLNENLTDVDTDIDENCTEKLMEKIVSIKGKITIQTSEDSLKAILGEYGLSEISIANSVGIVITSTNSKYIGFDMHSGEQSKDFCALLGSGLYYVKQDYMATSLDPSVYMRYGGGKLEGGFFFGGYNAEAYKADYIGKAYNCIKNRHVDSNGGILLTDKNGLVICDNLGGGQYTSQYMIDDLTLLKSVTNSEIKDIFISEVECHSVIYKKNDCYIIVFIPKKDVYASSKNTILVLSLIQYVIFALLFAMIYFLTEKLIVRKFENVAISLNKISSGNLEERLEVKGSVEFDSLSKDINCTVATLEKYIKDAENRMNAELELARQIQKSSLPSYFPAYPERKDFDIYASMDAAKEVGGDFYDFYLIDKNKILFLIADVSGKGIPAALFMMKTKTMLKSLIESGKSIEEAFKITNENLCRNNDADMFVTSFAAVLNLTNGELQYVNAGHCYPLISRKNGPFEYIKEKPNFVLGGLEGVDYSLHTLNMDAGDRLFLYTDGVSESKNVNGDLFGEERLKESLSKISISSNVKEICEAIKKDLEAFSLDSPQFDDITMLTLRINSLIASNFLDLKPTLNSNSIIKNFIIAKGEELGILKESLSKILIVSDEIYSNIVKYSKASSCRVSLEKEGSEVTLLLVENGDQFDPTSFIDQRSVSSPNHLEEGGLGLLITKTISKEFSYKYENELNVIKIVFENK